MRGMIGGMVSGGLVSALALGVASVMGEQPAGVTPPAAPLVAAPAVADVATVEEEIAAVAVQDAPSSPVGSITIEEPQAPDLPENETATAEPVPPSETGDEPEAPPSDTAPLDEPAVVAVEGTMVAPEIGDEGGFTAEPDVPVLPNPQTIAPQTPANEADVTVSTTPAKPLVEDAAEVEVVEVIVSDEEVTAPSEARAEQTAEFSAAEAGDEAGDDSEEFFVVDLGAQTEDAPTDVGEDAILAAPFSGQSRFQLQGGENTFLNDSNTGVIVRRPGSEEVATEEVSTASSPNALVDFRADAVTSSDGPKMSIVLIDDGSMDAASAALAGLPFPVTIALDPSLPDAAEKMRTYRAAGFEVAVIAKVPAGAQPSDVEVAFQSVFRALPESVAVLDLGTGGFQSDRLVAEQTMAILAASGRGFVSPSQGLNMASRAAEQAGVPAAIIFRDLDADGQDDRVIRRFVDQASFRARQESGVVLVARVRPETLSALISWGTNSPDDQVSVVPVSAVLLGE